MQFCFLYFYFKFCLAVMYFYFSFCFIHLFCIILVEAQSKSWVSAAQGDLDSPVTWKTHKHTHSVTSYSAVSITVRPPADRINTNTHTRRAESSEREAWWDLCKSAGDSEWSVFPMRPCGAVQRLYYGMGTETEWNDFRLWTNWIHRSLSSEGLSSSSVDGELFRDARYYQNDNIQCGHSWQL